MCGRVVVTASIDQMQVSTRLGDIAFVSAARIICGFCRSKLILISVVAVA
jgi:hypothetical protein